MQKPSYAVTHERDVADPEWLGPYGCARLLVYGPRGLAKVLPPSAVQQRAGGRVRRAEKQAPLPAEQRGGWLHFEARKGGVMEPIRVRVGRRVVTDTITVTSKSGRAHYVRWRCDCGGVGRMCLSEWRRAIALHCTRCARRLAKEGFLAAPPLESARARAEREAEEMRRNPMFGATVA